MEKINLTKKSTLTKEQQQSIATFLRDRHIPAGLGTEDAPCSIGAINVALTGELTDQIPDCMSEVVGRWIIVAQDSMPGRIRNSDEWRRLLPLAAGTGRELEAERLALVMDWLWRVVLPYIQPLATQHGFGDAWETMCASRTAEAAKAAKAAAWGAAEAAEAGWTARAAARAAAKAADAAWAAAEAKWEAQAAWAAAEAADVAWAAAEATWEAEAAWPAAKAAKAAAWATFDPCALLLTLIECKPAVKEAQ